MKGMFRVLGVTVAVFFIVLFTTATVSFIKMAWFGSKPGAPAKKTSGEKYVAVIDMTGVIYTSNKILKRIEKISEDDNVKAVVLRINSPGGVVAPSQEIYEAIKKLDKKVPVVASMQSLAASGGYYVALGARKIYANSGTLTASIGVIMEFANLAKLYEWAKVERYEITAGKLKGLGSETRPMRPEERAIFESMLSDIHGIFKAVVKERRKLTDAEVEQTCDGRIMTGHQAKVAKLVDELGGFQPAVADAKKLGNLPENAPVHEADGQEGFLKKWFLGDDEAEGLSAIGEALSSLNQSLRSGWRVMLLAPVASK